MGKRDAVHPTYDSDYEDGRETPEMESLNCCQLKVHQNKIQRDWKKHHLDATYDGPLKKRSCTDIICLLLLIVAIAAWVALGVYAFSSGSPGEIFAPRNTKNQKCGYDEGVEDKPYLIFFDLTKCVLPTGAGLFKCDTPQVCVSECPSENFYFNYYYTIPGTDPKFVANKMICLPGTDLSNIQMDKLKEYVDKNICAPWYLDSASVAHRCLPDLSGLLGLAEITVPVDNGHGVFDNTTIVGVTGATLNEASNIVQALSAVNEFGTAAVRDVMETWPLILACIGGAMVISFIYILIMRYIAGLMVWFSLIACIGIFGYCSYITWTKYDELRAVNKTEPPIAAMYARAGENSVRLYKLPRSSDEPSAGDVISDAIQQQLNSYLRLETTWLVFFIICVSILVILLVVTLFLRSRIRLAISLINEGSRAVQHSWSTLFFPIFPWILQVGVICYGVAICLFLFSSGVSLYKVDGLANDTDCSCTNGYEDGKFCTVENFKEYCKNGAGGECVKAGCFYLTDESENFTIYLQLYNLFIFFWTLFFVSAVGQLILSSTFATYYWTFNKSDIPFFIVASSAWRVIRYHLGTAAFGSLLLAIVNWLRALLEMSDSYLKKYDNGFVRAIKCCMRCFFWCLEKFLRFLNKNAYIMCSIHGKNFCASAKDAFMLLLRNVIRVFVLDKVTDFLFFISKLVITAAVGAASFYIFSKPVVNLQDLDAEPYQSTYSFVPIAFVVIGAYFISSIFFNVYSMAVDTLFLCFLEDLDINDGSQEKPYFMTKNLMSLLGKKNKKD